MAEPCRHGEPLGECPESTCQEITQLLATKPGSPAEFKTWNAHSRLEIALEKESQNRWKQTGTVEAVDEQETSAQLEKREVAASDPEPDKKIRKARSLIEIFSTNLKIRYAEQHEYITEREASILRELLAAGGQIKYPEIARRIGCSRDTISRDFRKLVGRFMHPDDRSERTAAGTVVATRVRGERKEEYWVAKEDHFDEFCETWFERITDRARITKLRREARVTRQTWIPYKSSPMQILFAALSTEFAPPGLKLFSDPLQSLYRESPSWSHNREWARRRIQGKRKLWDTPSYGEILTRLGRNMPICRYCHTPILVGCRLGNQLVTRRRKFCDGACKMNLRRVTERGGGRASHQILE